jgi:hypothetical protein
MNTDSTAARYLMLFLDTMEIVRFDDRAKFRLNCRCAETAQAPYATFELRERHGNMLWHPTETRFFDPSAKKV